MIRKRYNVSERAAGNTAFIFSLTDSCALLDINPEEYLAKVFTCLTSKEECDMRQLLPCYINSRANEERVKPA